MLVRMHHFLPIFLLSIILTGCGGGSDSTDNNPVDTNPPADTALSLDELKTKIHQMDLTDAQGFVITGSSTTAGKPALRYKGARVANQTAVNMDPNSLYKVNSDGTLERVAVKDADNSEIDRGLVQPFGLREVNANYLFMWFRIEYLNPDDPLAVYDSVIPYLVHKKTGLAYIAEDVIWQQTVGYVDGDSYIETIDQQYKKIRSDNKGNIYVGHNDTVYKIDTSNLGATSITAQAVQTQYKVHSTQWDIDDSGSILLFNGVDSDSSGVDIYVDLNDGSLSRVGQTMSETLANYNTMESIYRGLDGNLYIVGYNDSTFNAYLFQASQDQSGKLVLTAKRNLGDDPLHYYLWGNHQRHVINGKLIYFNANIGYNSTYMGEIYEFDHKTGIISEHLIPATQFQGGRDAIKGITVSNGYIYFFGPDQMTTVDTVYRYDPVTKTGDLFPTDTSSPINDFDIGNIKVLNNNKIWFDAFRFSDSSTVIGEMDMDASSIIIIDTIDPTEPAIIVMEAIHPADFIAIDGSYQDWHTDLRVQTDASDDGSAGHELTFLSHQQASSQFFGLVEFDQDVIQTTDAATVITIDGMYSIVIKIDEAFIIDLADYSEISFNDAGAISAIGQAVEFSVPLASLSTIGTSPTVTVRSVSLENVVAEDVYDALAQEHTVTITLPRALSAEDDVIIQLVGTYELQLTSTTIDLVDTSDSSSIAMSAMGLDTASVVVIIGDVLIGTPDSTLSPSTQDQLDITQDEM